MKDLIKKARADNVGLRVTAHLPRGGQTEGVILKIEHEEGRGAVATLDTGYSITLGDILAKEPLPKHYVSTYCNFPHSMKDGKPIRHGCRVLPPAALRLERNGLVPEAIQLLQKEG